MRIRRFIHLLLFFIAIVLMWRIVETWRRTPPTLTTAHQSQPQDEAPLRFAPAPVPAVGEKFARVMTEKDLFSPSRSRTVEEVQPTVVTVPPPAHLKLVGVVLFPDHEEAFFVDSSQGGKVVRLRKGETLGSYHLVEVMPLQATLTLGQEGEEVNLPLVVIDSGTAARAPRLIPPMVQAVPSIPRARQPRAVPASAGGEITDETQAIRQNIQQLQRRLRQIRRQNVRQEAENQEIEPPSAEEGGGEEGEE
jgi:type II secretory pathway component PulC